MKGKDAMSAKKKSNYAGKTALLVDDDPDCLAQVKMHLEGLGFKVASAETQSEGEKLIDSQSFDIAVFDLMLENQDSGFILSYKVKKKSPSVPVIIITGVTSETGIHFDLAGDDSKAWIKADAILDKQIRFEQLNREIDRLMSA